MRAAAASSSLLAQLERDFPTIFSLLADYIPGEFRRGE